MEHLAPESYARGAAKALSIADSVVPRLTESVLGQFGFDVQKTTEPKGSNGDNLWRPIEGYNRAHGDFSRRARSWSLYNWVQTHPRSRFAVSGALLGVAGLLFIR